MQMVIARGRARFAFIGQFMAALLICYKFLWFCAFSFELLVASYWVVPSLMR